MGQSIVQPQYLLDDNRYDRAKHRMLPHDFTRYAEPSGLQGGMFALRWFNEYTPLPEHSGD
jgi:hypothetical protein